MADVHHEQKQMKNQHSEMNELGWSDWFEQRAKCGPTAKVEFVLHLGDIVDNAEIDEQWDYVLNQAARYELKLMPVVGNHDRMLAYGDRGEIRFRQFFPELPETFYRFSHRGLGFLMLNSEHSMAPWSQQGRFIDWQLEQHPHTAVVCLHRPVFTCGHRDIGKQYLRRVWLHGRLAGTEAALVLSGHHHYYDRTKPLDGITYVTSGGASHKLYGPETPDERTAVFRGWREPLRPGGRIFRPARDPRARC